MRSVVAGLSLLLLVLMIGQKWIGPAGGPSTNLTRFEQAEALFQHADYVGAAEAFLSLWEEGDAHAGYRAAQILEMGYHDRDTADQAILKLYQQAASQGTAGAHYRLADIYLYGRGIQVDHVKAREHLVFAKEGGLGEAAFVLRANEVTGGQIETKFNLLLPRLITAENAGSLSASTLLCQFAANPFHINLDYLHHCEQAVEAGDQGTREYLSHFLAATCVDDPTSMAFLVHKHLDLENNHAFAASPTNSYKCRPDEGEAINLFGGSYSGFEPHYPMKPEPKL